ncbi:hypothetical protein [Paraglaciecola arctica]|nr:hypothetical protein [Paraglaciecola arctica]
MSINTLLGSGTSQRKQSATGVNSWMTPQELNNTQVNDIIPP